MKKEEILNKYWSLLKSDKEIYIYGARICGEYILQYLTNNNIKVKSFIDDDKNIIGQIKNNAEICHSSVLKDINSVIIVASVNNLYTIVSKLNKKGFKNIIPYFIFTLKNFSDFYTFYNGLFDDYSENKKKYDNLFLFFKDKLSVDTLNVLINFRKTYDLSLFHQICQNHKNQYFDFFDLKDNIFVDGGAFIGDTSLKFVELNKQYKKIYAFEPDKISFGYAKRNLQKFNNINVYNKGLSDNNELLVFKSMGNVGSAFTKEGNCKVETVCMDDIVMEERAFIKLDIEGFEYRALCGARKLIQNNSKMAISLYHNPSDIWKIPELILSINKNYKLFLRHYSNTVFDTILYAISDKY